MKDIIINILWCVGGVSLVSYLATILYLNARESRAAEQERLDKKHAARMEYLNRP